MTDFRDTCYRCCRPKAHCLCDLIPEIDNRTDILVLQHKCERTHPFGTARFVRLGLRRAEVRLVFPDETRRFTVKPCVQPGAGLLYPCDGAIDLETVPPLSRPTQLVVLDGTWDDAKQLYQDNAWLRALPHYCLRPASPSIYRIRREPCETAVSTIEAILLALSILEPETQGMPALLAAFDTMIERQLACSSIQSGQVSTRRKKKPRQRPSRAVPTPLLDHYDDLIVAYGESVPWVGKRRFLVSFAAVRLGDEAPFEQFLAPAPNATLTDDHVDLMNLTRAHWDRALEVDELRRRWRQYVRPTDLLVSWNASTLALLKAALGDPPPSLFLKESYCNVTGTRCGHLQDVVRKHAFELRPLPLSGRAALRVAQAIATIDFLRGGQPR